MTGGIIQGKRYRSCVGSHRVCFVCFFLKRLISGESGKGSEVVKSGRHLRLVDRHLLPKFQREGLLENCGQ